MCRNLQNNFKEAKNKFKNRNFWNWSKFKNKRNVIKNCSSKKRKNKFSSLKSLRNNFQKWRFKKMWLTFVKNRCKNCAKNLKNQRKFHKLKKKIFFCHIFHKLLKKKIMNEKSLKLKWTKQNSSEKWNKDWKSEKSSSSISLVIYCTSN